jgi:signal transduction histidine kinase/ActR/RegA family two-component response regulator
MPISRQIKNIAHVALCLLALWSVPAVPAPSPKDGASTQVPAETSFAQIDAAIEKTKNAMMGDPETALATAQQADAIAARLPDSPRASIAKATVGWLHGEALIFMNKGDEAAPIIAAAFATAERFSPNTKLHGDLLRSRGAISAMKGNVLSALNDYQRSYKVFTAAKVPRSQAIALQDIGGIYWEAGDYERVLSYFNQSGEVFSGDPSLTLTMHNNRAEVYRKQKQYAKATLEYRAAFTNAKKLESPMLEIRILTNLAGSEADAGHLPSAKAAAQQALALASHGEAADWKPFVYGITAKVAAMSGDSAKASQLFARAFEGVDFQKSDLLFSEYHEAAYHHYDKLGDKSLALAHLKAFQRLDREAQRLTASTASQLMAAQFDFANQNLKISRLKEDQLKRDVQLARLQLIAVSVVFSLLLLGFFQVRRSRNRISAANDALTTSNTSLEKALRAKTEFLAMTSHEIRTPLNGILGMTQVLLADRSVTPDVRERIDVVNSAGETMRALVDDILDVAKMESGELTIAHEKTDLRAILDQTAKLWAGQAETKKLDLIVATDTAPAQIKSDGGRIRQIIFNLMSNGLKFTHNGSVTLSVIAEPGSTAGEDLVIRVIDTGIGIAADKYEEIFESFKQVDGGTTRQFGGTGLGLAICKRLAEAMDGTIGVESEVGQGSTFTVRLPFERLGSEAATATSVSDGPTLSDSSFLIIESGPANLSMLRLMLAAEGARVTVASNADEAVIALKENLITHALLDTGCLTTDGADPKTSLLALAEAANQAHAYFSLMMAPSATMTIADAMMIGASQLIVKPIGIDDLFEALQSLYGPDAATLVAPSLGARAA